MSGGFWDKVLRVNLSTKNITVEELDAEIAKQYIGGAGVAAVYLYKEVPAEVGPLDAENRLIFSTGPFQASKMSGAAKFSVVSRSPLTGIFADSAAGAGWGISFKRTGFDFIIFQGKCSEPVYLYIENGEASLKSALDIWGLDSIETYHKLLKKHPHSSVASIGQAGEHKIAMANIYVDGFSAAGRCGLGAVMGSKNLKAVVVHGTLKPPVYDDEELKRLESKYRKIIYKTSEALREGGTIGGLTPGEESGNLPVKNWSMVGWHEGALKIGLPGYNDVLKPKPHACMYCSIACHRDIDVVFPDGYSYKGPGPEYETLALLGSSCLIDDLEALVKINDFCNRRGIDTMSAGSCAAFAMEALEKGHTKGYKPDYEFSWGNSEGLFHFIEELTENRGFGGLFSRGIKPASELFARESTEYACHVKGLDVPAHDPRVYYNMAINYATGNRGACHMRAYSQISTMGALLPEAGISVAPEPDTLEGAAHVVKVYQDFAAFYNSCVLCQFMIWGGYGLGDMVISLNAITGWEMTVEDVMLAGERIYTLQRMLNNRYGVTSKDDTLPKRFFEPSKSGARAGQVPEPFKESLKELYEERGWDKDGRPLQEKIEKLGINL